MADPISIAIATIAAGIGVNVLADILKSYLSKKKSRKIRITSEKGNTVELEIKQGMTEQEISELIGSLKKLDNKDISDRTAGVNFGGRTDFSATEIGNIAGSGINEEKEENENSENNPTGTDDSAKTP